MSHTCDEYCDCNCAHCLETRLRQEESAFPDDAPRPTVTVAAFKADPAGTVARARECAVEVVDDAGRVVGVLSVPGPLPESADYQRGRDEERARLLSKVRGWRDSYPVDWKERRALDDVLTDLESGQ